MITGIKLFSTDAYLGRRRHAGQKNPDLAGKNLPAPAPEEQQTISALYFRPSDPRFVHLTLTRENSAVPVMVGDILTLTVYTPLYENDATRKGGHMYIKTRVTGLMSAIRPEFWPQTDLLS